MKLHTRATTNAKSTMTTGIIIGTVVAVAISFLLSMGLTSLILSGNVQENNLEVYVFIVRSMAILLGSLLASAIVKEKNLQVIGSVTALYLLFLLGGGIVLYNGSFHNFGLGLLSVITGGGIACIIKIIPRKNKFHFNKIKKKFVHN